MKNNEDEWNNSGPANTAHLSINGLHCIDFDVLCMAYPQIINFPGAVLTNGFHVTQ